MAMKRNQRRKDKNEHHKGSLLEGVKTKNGKANRICKRNKTVTEYNPNDDKMRFKYNVIK
jgi:hypothetical protein